MVTHKVQAHNVVVSFAGVELDGKATRIPGKIRELSAQSDGRVSDEDRGANTRASKKMGLVASS